MLGDGSMCSPANEFGNGAAEMEIDERIAMAAVPCGDWGKLGILGA
jgi:hypothetical protein